MCGRFNLGRLAHIRLATGLPYDPLTKNSWLFEPGKNKNLKDFSLEVAKLLKLLQLRPNLLRLTASYMVITSVSESLVRMNIPRDEHAYIGRNEH